jgi:hypothetical protein
VRRSGALNTFPDLPIRAGAIAPACAALHLSVAAISVRNASLAGRRQILIDRLITICHDPRNKKQHDRTDLDGGSSLTEYGRGAFIWSRRFAIIPRI